MSVLPLNENKNLLKQFLGAKSKDELEKSVLLNLAIDHEIRWKSDVKCIQLELSDKFEEKGILTLIEELQPKPNRSR